MSRHPSTHVPAPSTASRRIVLLWRLHVWAALLLSPLLLLVTLTGLLYVFTPQIETLRHGHLLRVQPGTQQQPLAQQMAAAQAQIPSGWQLHSLILPQAATDSLQLLYRPPVVAHGGPGQSHHAGHGLWLYVDPWRAVLLGQLPEQEQFNVWARQLHSRFLLGDSWRWLSELAASWLLFLLLSGVYMCWLRRAQFLRQLRQPGPGRAGWLLAHWLPGVSLAALTLIMVTTGITWSAWAGSGIRWLRDISGQAPPRPPAHLHSQPGAPLALEQIVARARQLQPDLRLQLQRPAHADGTWKISSADRTQPRRQFELRLDAVSGEPLYFAGWAEQTAFSRATAIGIPFHRGELGWWNQALLLLFGLSVLWSLLSGWRLLLGRRHAGGPWLPPLLPGSRAALSPVLVLATLLLLLFLPLLALSALVLAVLEYRLYCQSRRRRA